MVDRYIQDVLIRKPKSFTNQKTQLLWWKSELGEYFLADVTPSIISSCRDKLINTSGTRKDKRALATVNRYMAALSHAFTIAVKEWGWLEDSPISKVSKLKEPRGRVRFLSDDERERLLVACQKSTNEYLYLIVVLALGSVDIYLSHR